MSHTPTVALSEPRTIGDIVELLGQRYRITAPLTREDYLRDLQQRRDWDRARGLPAARAGTYAEETREFKPGREVPAECTHYYRVEPEPPR